jgi:hypothetical protein
MNEYGIPEIAYMENDNNTGTKTVFVQEIGNQNMYFKYEYQYDNVGTEFEIQFDEQTCVGYYIANDIATRDNKVISYCSNLGFVLVDDTEIIENSDIMVSSIINERVVEESSEPIDLKP